MRVLFFAKVVGLNKMLCLHLFQMASGSTHVAGGDSSESHDTDHQVDDEPLDEMDSPPAVSKHYAAIRVYRELTTS